MPNDQVVREMTVPLSPPEEGVQPYEIRVYDEIYNDLFESKSYVPVDIIQRQYVIATIREQVIIESGTGPIEFLLKTPDGVLRVELVYTVYLCRNDTYPWVLLMPTWEQIQANLS